MGLGAGEGAGAGREPTGVPPVRNAQRAATTMRERGIQSLGKEWLALCKYACDAAAILETVH
eukprot:6179166-Pleurochrysis_carterae.AAC.1